jgi:molybdopterin-containing oxidoreductase family iron-sulfur binding subunit
MADDVIALELGQGRGEKRAGRFGSGAGFNVAKLIAPGTGITPFLAAEAQVSRSGKRYPLVATQRHDFMEGRPIVLQGTLEQYRNDPKFVGRVRPLPKLAEIHRPYKYTGFKWAMAIDMNACQGCGGCIAACMAENNIAAVGKKECGRGRNMQWLRLDRYYTGEQGDPGILHQLMLCQHCENAPCENVCPVAATTHSADGLNEMTYNRCVGTRYCSNNCPYKIRHFNFFNYTKRFTDYSRLALIYNPRVTVRSVGVMEKCTYCVQRLAEAKFRATRTGIPLRDGEVKTACQQACAAGAIVFGDLNDPESAVSRLYRSERGYHLLAELNTKPRTLYLAKISNPGPGTAAARRIYELQNSQQAFLEKEKHG